MRKIRVVAGVLVLALGLLTLAGCWSAAYWWKDMGCYDCAPCGDPYDPCDTRR